MFTVILRMVLTPWVTPRCSRVATGAPELRRLGMSRMAAAVDAPGSVGMEADS